MNYPITRHRDRYPSPHCAHALICYWYFLLVCTSITRTLLLFHEPEILPCSLIMSTTTDFRISQYSSTHIFYFLPGIFYFPVVVKHCTSYYIYQCIARNVVFSKLLLFCESKHRKIFMLFCESKHRKNFLPTFHFVLRSL